MDTVRYNPMGGRGWGVGGSDAAVADIVLYRPIRAITSAASESFAKLGHACMHYVISLCRFFLCPVTSEQQFRHASEALLLYPERDRL